MSAVTTALLVAVTLLLLGLIVVGPIRAVREDRRLAAEERGWLEADQFPAKVERVYRGTRSILTDGPRLRELGYEPVVHHKARGSFGRVREVVWEAASPPARPRSGAQTVESPCPPRPPAPARRPSGGHGLTGTPWRIRTADPALRGRWPHAASRVGDPEQRAAPSRVRGEPRTLTPGLTPPSPGGSQPCLTWYPVADSNRRSPP